VTVSSCEGKTLDANSRRHKVGIALDLFDWFAARI
jgi:hypothetical protein